MKDSRLIPHRSSFDLWAVAIPLVLYLVIALHFFYFFVDDSFITLRYAEHLWNGKGLVWNVGERVEGISNCLWAIMLSPLTPLGHDHVYAGAKFLGILFGAGAVATTYFLILGITNSRWAAVTLGCWLGGTAYWCAWAASGMETPFYAFLLILAAAMGALAINHRAYSARIGAFLGAVLGAAALTRPEGSALAILALLSMLGCKQRRIFLAAAISSASLTLIGLLWRFSYYHDWVPNTYFAKVGGFSLTMFGATIANYTLPFLHEVIGAAATAAIVLGFLSSLKETRSRNNLKSPSAFVAIFAAAAILFQSLFVIRTGGDWMPGFRFMIVILPFVAALVGVVWAHISRRLGNYTFSPALVVTGIVVFLPIQIVGTNVAFRTVASPIYYSHSWWKSPTCRTKMLVPDVYREGESTLERTTTADELIAIDEGGYVPWAVPRRYLDLYGLNDAVLVHIPGLTRQSTGIILNLSDSDTATAGERYIISRHPRVILVGNDRWRSRQTLLGRYHRIETSNGFSLYR